MYIALYPKQVILKINRDAYVVRYNSDSFADIRYPV